MNPRPVLTESADAFHLCRCGHRKAYHDGGQGACGDIRSIAPADLRTCECPRFQFKEKGSL